MGGTRAVIASLGASISIVACAALGLFAVSVLFAYPGIAGSLNGSGSSPTLIVASRGSDAATQPAGKPAAVKPLRVSAPVVRPSKSQTETVRRTSGTVVDRASQSAPTRQPTVTADVTDAPALSPPSAASGPTVSVPAVTKKAGQGVRQLGDTLAGTVQSTGDAAGSLAKPLGPPVSKAVQDVLNVAVKAINDLLKRTTGGLAGTLDAASR